MLKPQINYATRRAWALTHVVYTDILEQLLQRARDAFCLIIATTKALVFI